MVHGMRTPPMARYVPLAYGLVSALSAVLLGSAVGRTATTPFPDFAPDAAKDYLQSVSELVRHEIGNGADLSFAQARAWSSLGRQDEAERLGREALALDPERADIHLFLGELCVGQDRMSEAEASLRRAVQLDPGLAGAHRRWGMALDRLGDRDAAQRAFETAVSLQPADATARLLLGQLLLNTDRAAEALPHLIKACELDPRTANPYYVLAQAQNRLGSRDEARTILRKFHELKREEQQAADARNRSRDDAEDVGNMVASYHTDVAMLAARLDRADLAEAHLCQAIAIAPNQVVSRRLLADRFLQTQRLTLAKPMLQALVRLEPDDASHQVNLGTLMLQLGEHEAAVDHLKQALTLDPELPEALNNLARFSLVNRRDLAAALEWSRRLAVVQPTAASFDLLGWAAYANGHLDEARAATAHAVKLDPANSTYRQRLRRLQELSNP